MPKFRTALGWAFVLNWGRQSAASIITFVLASLLGPDAFGTVALAQVYILLMEMLQEQGLSNALIQRKDLDDLHLDTAFWLNLGLTTVLWSVSMLFAPYWAHVNDMPELAPVIMVLATMLPLRALTVVQQAVLARALDFRSLALRTNVSVWTGGAVGISLAVAGFGVWALVAQNLAVAATSLILLWSLSGWRPRLRFDPAALRQLFRFSSGAMLARLGTFTQRRGEVLVMGMVFGPVAVGLYRLAQRLMEVPLELSTRSVQTVSLSEFSRRQGDPEGLRRGVENGIWIGTTMALPALFVLAALGRDVLVLVGGEWTDATLALQLLCLSGAVSAAIILAGPLMQSSGRPHLMAALNWIWGAISIGSTWAVGGWLAGAPVASQVAGVAAMRASLAVLLQLPVHLGILIYYGGLTVGALVKIFAPPVASGAGAYAAAAAMSMFLPMAESSNLLRFAVHAGVTGIVAVGLLLALDPRTREVLKQARRRTQVAVRSREARVRD